MFKKVSKCLPKHRRGGAPKGHETTGAAGLCAQGFSTSRAQVRLPEQAVCPYRGLIMRIDGISLSKPRQLGTTQLL